MKQLISIFLIMFFFTGISISQRITNSSIIKINNKVSDFVRDYIAKTNINSSQLFFSPDYYDEMEKMHEAGLATLVFNDLASDSLPQQITVSQYMSVMLKRFKSIDIKTAIVGNISAPGLLKNGGYRIVSVVQVSKSIIGFTKQKKVVRAKNNLFITVSYFKAGAVFSHFRVECISTEMSQLLPLIDYSYSQVGITANLNNTKTITQSTEWLDPNDKRTGFNGEFTVLYNLNRTFALGTGISYSPISLEYRNENFLYSKNKAFTKTDPDGDTYMPIYSGNIAEKSRLALLSIPLFLEAKYGYPNKLNFFIRGGIELANVQFANVYVSGNLETKGYYSSMNLVLGNVPEYGFENKTLNIERSISSSDLKQLYFISAGCYLPIRTKFMATASVSYRTMQQALITNQDAYRFDYAFYSLNPNNIKYSSIGFNLGLVYKFN